MARDQEHYVKRCVSVVAPINQVSGLFLGAHGPVGTSCPPPPPPPQDSTQGSAAGPSGLSLPRSVPKAGLLGLLVGPLASWLPAHLGQEERKAKGLCPQLWSPKLQVVWVPLVSVTIPLPAL